MHAPAVITERFWPFPRGEKQALPDAVPPLPDLNEAAPMGTSTSLAQLHYLSKSTQFIDLQGLGKVRNYVFAASFQDFAVSSNRH
jgi:hypothetical protein